MIQSQSDLHSTADTGCHTHMSDLTLYRADNRFTFIALRESLYNRTDFTGITCGSARSVRFQQTNSIHIHTAVLISAVQRADLSFLTGCINALCTSVGGGPAAADHCVNLISVPLRIGKTLQNHNSHTVPQNHAVCLLVKGFDFRGF